MGIDYRYLRIGVRDVGTPFVEYCLQGMNDGDPEWTDLMRLRDDAVSQRDAVVAHAGGLAKYLGKVALVPEKELERVANPGPELYAKSLWERIKESLRDGRQEPWK